MPDCINDDNGEQHQIICQMNLRDAVQEIKRQTGHPGIRGGEGRKNHQALVDITSVPIEKTEASQSYEFSKRGTDQGQAGQCRSGHMVPAEFGGDECGRHCNDKNQREQRESYYAEATVKIDTTRGNQ